MKLKSLSQKDRYGNMFSVEFFEPDTTIPMMMVIPDMPDGFNGADTDNHPGDPKGTDTVPAWLTPGENVVNAEASRIPGNQEKIDQMNEEGRQIQKSQGGPIPTYESDGGFIQGVTDFFTMPTPPAGSGIEYRRHKDGSIGMWTGNTYRGKYKEPSEKESSFSDRLGISYNYGGGNIPPMYANQGALAEFLKAEEGLRNEAYLDSAGVPTIGYGSTYGVKMGDKLSDAQANQQLMKDISVAEEDYNNLVDVDLNPNQQNAVKSLLFNIGGPQFANSRARAALNAGDFDTFQKEASEFRMAGGEVLPGLEARRAREMDLFQTPYETADADKDTGFSFIKSAQASTLVPEQDQAPPKFNKYDLNKDGTVDKEEAKLARDSLMNQKPSNVGTPGGVMPSGGQIMITGPDSLLARQEQILDEMIETGASVEDLKAQGDKVARIKGIPPKQEAFSERRAIENQVDESEKEVTKLTTQIAALNSAGLTEQANTKQEELDKKSNELSNLKSNLAKASAKEDTLYDTKPTQQDEYEEASGTTATDQQKSALTDAAASAPDSEQPPSGNPEVDKEIEKAGETADPTLIDQVMGPLQEAFGDLFNPKELARMALLYTGSRLMGYSHEGSFAYGAKSYLNRIDAMDAQFQKDIRDDDYQDFTEKSRKEFEETRDYSVLRKKKTPVSMTETTGTTYVRGVGIVNTVKLSDKTEGVLINGKPVRITQVIDKDSGLTLADIMEPVDKEVHSVQSVRKRLDEVAEEARKSASQNIGLEEGKGLSDDSSSVAMEAASKFNKILLRNGASIAQAEDMEIVVNGAIKDYYNAKAQAKRDGTKMPHTVEAYIEQRMIEPLTNNTITADMVRGTSADNLRALNKRIYRGMDNKDKRNPAFQTEYMNEWAATKAAWQAIGDEQAEWIRKAEKKDGYSAFTLWMSKTADEDIDKIIEEANK